MVFFMEITERLLTALVRSILFLALAHFLILVAYFLVTFDLAALNIFKVLDLDLFFPYIARGSTSFLVSTVLLIVLYLIMFVFFSKPE